MNNAVKWASDKLIRQNYTWTSRIPSDIRPGLYILRHELLALHDAKRSYNGFSQSGAQVFPVCYNVEITGSGTVTPAGKTFPGMYSKNDPGIKIDLDALNAPYVSNYSISRAKTCSHTNADCSRPSEVQRQVRRTHRP
jgi:lytic cellulose monooxygenase (C1-hydroxylating)